MPARGQVAPPRERGLKLKRYANREEKTVCIYLCAFLDLVFSRDDEKSINAALGYGYAPLLSFVDREIVSRDV